MIKKFFFLGFLFFLLILVVGGWFGYQAWVHASRSAAVQARQAEVVAKWAMDPAAIKQASSGRGGITVSNLDQNWQHDGVSRFDAYKSKGSTLKVRYADSGCYQWPYIYDIKRVNGTLSVMVYVDQPWLPDFGVLWLKVTGRWACSGSVKLVWMSIPLDAPLSNEAVIDGATGRSVGLLP